MCPIILDFWSNVFTWQKNSYNSSNYQVEGLSILYGFNLKKCMTIVFNYIILIAKWHLYIQKVDNNAPNLDTFPEIRKDRILVKKNSDT